MTMVGVYRGGSFTFTKNRYGQGSGAYSVHRFNRGRHALSGDEELWMDWYIKPHRNWQEGMGGKLLGMAGGTATTGGRPVVPNGWSARVMWGNHRGLRLYLYHQDRPGKYGHNFAFNGIERFEKNRWSRVTERVKINDPGRKNAEIQFWVDGKSVVEVDKIALRGDVGSQTALVDRCYMTPFRGGNSQAWAVDRDTTLYFSDVQVSDSQPDFKNAWWEGSGFGRRVEINDNDPGGNDDDDDEPQEPEKPSENREDIQVIHHEDGSVTIYVPKRFVDVIGLEE